MTSNDPPRLGLAALTSARAELARGVSEQPAGSNRGPDVDRYLLGCVRHGRRIWPTVAALPTPGPAWCATFASWCVWSAYVGSAGMGEDEIADFAEQWRRFEDEPPIGYRASVRELIADALATGTWHDRAPLTDRYGEPIAPAYAPQPGDLACFRRDSHDPRIGGEGHVEIVEHALPEAMRNIGGNVDNAIRCVLHSLSEEPAGGECVGWIAVG